MIIKNTEIDTEAIYERIATDDFAWARQELIRAYEAAGASPDPSTQNGALVYSQQLHTMTVACNAFTGGVDTESVPGLLVHPKKYAFIEHAERNAVYELLSEPHRTGVDDRLMIPTVMVAAWAACADCARAIVRSGIKILVRHDRSDLTGRWNESIEHGNRILDLGGVMVVDVTAGTLGAPPVLFNGELIHP